MIKTKKPTSASPSSPRVGGRKNGIAQTGGSFVYLSSNPKVIKAYTPPEFKFLQKTEEFCTEGLAASKRLDLASNTKSTVTLMSWIKKVQIYMEERGLDSVFRLYYYKNNKEYYLFKKWAMVRKSDQIDHWIKHLKRVLN